MFTENDIKKYIPLIIDIYSELFGEEYRNIIKIRLNSLQYFIYDNITAAPNVEGFESYYDYLLNCKQKELSTKSPELMEIEYKNHKATLEPYRMSMLEKHELKENIYNEKSEKFLEKSYSELPFKIKFLMYKNHQTMQSFLGCTNVLEEKSNIEFFSSSFDKILEDPNENVNTKETIKNFRMQYLSSLEASIDPDIDCYEDVIKRRKIKKLIPSKETVENIINSREIMLNEAKKEYYYTQYDLEKYPSYIEDSRYNAICNNDLCISSSVDYNFTDFDSTLYFTIRYGEYGILDYALLHELCHVIETNIFNDSLFIGFNIGASKNKLEYNPYDKHYKKYERLNENITDIFAIDALGIMRSKGIYMLEDENTIKGMDEIKNHNTSQITKNLLRPFVQKYREQIIQARITGNSTKLLTTIGKENFEELNDAINKLDYLIYLEGIYSIEFINEKSSNVNIVECYNQLQRVEKIYTNMDDYKNNIEQINEITHNSEYNHSSDDMEIE